jgi:hypothetical protein
MTNHTHSFHQITYCQGHKETQEQKLNEKYNFQIKNKTKLYDSKTNNQEFQTRT